MRFDCHEPHIPINPDYPDTVIASGTDRSGNVSAMAAVVQRIGIVIDRIDSEDVINITVSIVVNCIGRLVSSA